MKTALRIMVMLGIALLVTCIILSDMIFDIRAAALMTVGIFSTMGIYECFNSIDNLSDDENFEYNEDDNSNVENRGE